MKKFISSVYAVLLIVYGSNLALADIKIVDAWIRPTQIGKNTALYLKIINDTPQDIVLTSAESSVARKVELHDTTDDHGIMKMHQISAIPCPVEQTTELKPGGMHIMLIGVKHDLKIDDNNVPINLHFLNQQDIILSVPVKKGPGCCGCHE